MGVALMPLTKKTVASTAKKASKKVATKVATSKAFRKKIAPKTGEETPAKLVKKPTSRVSTKKGTTGAKRKPSTPSMSVDFAPGTDMETAFQEVLIGGDSRAAVSHRLAAMWTDTKTRNGNDKPVSTILNHVIRRARANGYEIQQTWKLVKVDGSSPTPAKVDLTDEEKTTVRKATGADVDPAVVKAIGGVAKPAKATKRAAKAVRKAVKRPASA